MSFMLTESSSRDRVTSSIMQQVEFTERSQSTPIIFVVDADFSVRQSLEIMISTLGWKVETFASAREFLSYTRAAVPCCLILDTSLPDLSGLDLQARIAAERSHMPIVFLTDCDDIATTVKAMKAGAFEFFTKPCQDDMLLRAMREAVEWSRSALARRTQRQMLQSRYASLSPRERQVMTLVASGLPNKQVGGDLGISEITVKAHRGQVMQKMQADSLPDLVRMATRLGLTERFQMPISCSSIS